MACPTCGEDKPPYGGRGRKQCRDCNLAAQARWRARNPKPRRTARRKAQWAFFFESISLPDAQGCMTWLATTSPSNGGNVYGATAPAPFSRSRRAHIKAYEFWNGPVPKGLVIDHTCCNTLCCAPDHLEAVTQAENVRRGVARRRAVS